MEINYKKSLSFIGRLFFPFYHTPIWDAMKRNPLMSALAIGLFLVLLAVTSCCKNCDDYSQKHQYNIGDVVHHKLDPTLTFIIQDTTRSQCEVEYYVEDSDGNRDYILEINLKR